LTSYSVLLSGPRATVIATWPGEWADHSVKVTTLTDNDQAFKLAHLLIRLSDGAWDAAAWLDTHPVIEEGIAALAEQLRGPTEKIDEIQLSASNWHSGQWSFDEATDLLGTALPAALNRLPRAQRLTSPTSCASPSPAAERRWSCCRPATTPSRRHRGSGRCAR
jgi:hypothetical protein